MEKNKLLPKTKLKEKIEKFLEKKRISILILFFPNIILIFAFNFFLSIFTNLLTTSKITENKGNLKFNDIVSLKNLFKFQILEYPILYLVFFLFGLGIGLNFLIKIRRNFKSITNKEKGSIEFASLEEIEKIYRSIPLKDEFFEGTGGFPIARYKEKLFIDDSPTNNLTVGTSRSGKTEMIVYPLIDLYSRAKDIKNRPSFCVNDPKMEISSSTIRMLEKRGYQTLILNITDPLGGMGYNPLDIITKKYKEGKYGEAQLLTGTLTFSMYDNPSAKDKFFQNAAKSLVSAIILAHISDCIKNGEEDKINMYSVANFLVRYGGIETKQGNLLDLYFKAREDTDVAKLQYATAEFSDGLTRASVFASAMEKLTNFTNDDIAKMTAKSTFDMNEVGFGEKPIAIFMGTPDYDKSNHFLASIFVRQLYYVLAEKASKTAGQKCLREVIFLLEEFGNMPPIESIDSMVTVSLGRNIRFNFIIQAYSQLDSLYGNNIAKTILSNCGNQTYVLTTEYETAEKFAKLVGNKTITVESRSGKALSFDKNFSENIEARLLLTAEELMRLKEGETVVVSLLKRKTLLGERISTKPIFNTGKDRSILFKYEYLDEFNSNKSIFELKEIVNNIEKLNKNKSIGDYEQIISKYLDQNNLNEYEIDEISIHINNEKSFLRSPNRKTELNDLLFKPKKTEEVRMKIKTQIEKLIGDSEIENNENREQSSNKEKEEKDVSKNITYDKKKLDILSTELEKAIYIFKNNIELLPELIKLRNDIQNCLTESDINNLYMEIEQKKFLNKNLKNKFLEILKEGVKI